MERRDFLCRSGLVVAGAGAGILTGGLLKTPLTRKLTDKLDTIDFSVVPKAHAVNVCGPTREKLMRLAQKYAHPTQKIWESIIDAPNRDPNYHSPSPGILNCGCNGCGDYSPYLRTTHINTHGSESRVIPGTYASLSAALSAFRAHADNARTSGMMGSAQTYVVARAQPAMNWANVDTLLTQIQQVNGPPETQATWNYNLSQWYDSANWSLIQQTGADNLYSSSDYWENYALGTLQEFGTFNPTDPNAPTLCQNLGYLGTLLTVAGAAYFLGGYAIYLGGDVALGGDLMNFGGAVGTLGLLDDYIVRACEN